MSDRSKRQLGAPLGSRQRRPSRRFGRVLAARVAERADSARSARVTRSRSAIGRRRYSGVDEAAAPAASAAASALRAAQAAAEDGRVEVEEVGPRSLFAAGDVAPDAEVMPGLLEFGDGGYLSDPHLIDAALADEFAPYAEAFGAGEYQTNSRFVAESTSASWNGEVLTIGFREVGLVPGTATTVSISAEAAADGVFSDSGDCMVSLHSHSAVVDESRYVAESDGTVYGTVVLRLTAGIAVPSHAGCDMEIRQSFSVALCDLDTGASTFLRGAMAPAGQVS